MTQAPSPGPPPTGATRLLQRPMVIGALIYLFAFIVRLSNLGGVFTDFGVFPISTDSFYHLRRIHWAMMHGLRVPDFDHYVNFPDGANVNWPFGFDWLYAVMAKASYALVHGNAIPDEGWVTAVACLLTPLIGAFTPCLGYLVAARLAHAWAGIAAGLILIWLPSLWVVCAVGYIDHHVFESLCVGVYLWAIVRERPTWQHGILAGSAMAVGLVCATVMTLLLGFHALVTALWWMAHRKEPTLQRSHLNVSLWAWFTLLVGIAPFVATRIAEPHGINPSLTTAWLTAFGATGVKLVAIGWTQGFMRQRLWWGLAWLGLGLGVLPRIVLADAWHFARYGVMHLVAADPWLATIFESQPLLRSSFFDTTNNYTGFFWLLPLAWFGVAVRAWSKPMHAAGRLWVLLLFSVTTTGLALLQLKFSGLFAVPFAVVVGLAIADLPNRLAQLPHLGQRWRLALPGALLIGMLAPTVNFTLGAPTYIVSPSGAFVDVEQTLRWLATHTPATSRQGDRPYDYAILCDWTPGHWVIGVAGRPTVASPLGHTTPLRTGIRDAAAMFVLPPNEAFRLMDARRVRYVLVTPCSPKALAQDAAWNPATGTSAPWDDWNERLKGSLYARLVADEGVPRGDAALTQLRLVYESDFETEYPLFTQPHAAGKVFERVPGALVSGRTTPGARVQITTRIQTYFRREFDYLDEVLADEQGYFERRVPYAQQVSATTTLAANTPYRIVTPEGVFAAVATEADVRQGRTLQLMRLDGE